jgi:hypothetical protein
VVAIRAGIQPTTGVQPETSLAPKKQKTPISKMLNKKSLEKSQKSIKFLIKRIQLISATESPKLW